MKLFQRFKRCAGRRRTVREPNPPGTPVESNPLVYDEVPGMPLRIDWLHFSNRGSPLVGQFQHKVSNGSYKLEHRRCYLCGNDDYDEVARADPMGFVWGLCRRCGLLLQHTMLNGQSLDEFYESGEYQAICMGGLDDTRHFQLEYQVTSQYIAEAIRTQFPDVRDIKVVEMGCGSGGILLYLRECGACVKGFDIDQQRVEVGRQYFPELEVGDAMSHTDELNSCDVVLLSNVLEHLSSPLVFLSDLRSSMTNSAVRLVIDVPNLEGAFAYSTHLEHFFHIAHVSYFTSGTLARLVNSSGFEVIDILNRGMAMTLIARAKQASDHPRCDLYWAARSALHFGLYKRTRATAGIRAREKYEEILRRGVNGQSA